MTNRERLFAALEGRPLDRVPIWLLFPYHRTGYYVDVRTNPCYRHIFEASQEMAIMLDRRNLKTQVWGPGVVETDETVVEQGWQVHRHTLQYRGERLVAEYRSHGREIQIKKLVETEADLEVFCSLPVNTDAPAIRAGLDAQLPQYWQERAEFPAECGAMMLDLGEPISVLYHNANLTEYPIWSLSHRDLVTDLLRRLQEHYRLVYRYTLENRMAEVYFMVGSELASPPMVSRETFQQWVLPFAQELIGMVHAGGAKVIQHYHGQIRLLLEDFLTIGADGLHTIESPPVGNCTITQAFDVVGDRMTLIGNVQYDLFRSLTESEMAAEVARVLAEVNGRRWILSPSAGPYEATISDQMQRNYLAFLRAGWILGAR